MKIVFAPDWFLNFDVVIGIFSFFILALFSAFSWRVWKLSSKKSALYLGIGFFLIAIGELSTIFTKVVLYYDTTVTTQIGRAIVTQGIVGSVDIFYHLGFFFHRLLTLFGLYFIYRLPTTRKAAAPADVALTLYLIIMTSILSYSLYFFYHLTAFVLLALIIRDYTRIYKKDKVTNTLILICAFSMLAFGQIIFTFSAFGKPYVIAQIIQVVSYIIMLGLIIKILQDGKKKKQNGNNA